MNQKSLNLVYGLVVLVLIGAVVYFATGKKSVSSQVFENQFIKVTVPVGWTVDSPMPGAVNITKDNYILYINSQASQASGVTGGRFAEIAMGAPSADAVVLEQPSPPCGVSETHPALAEHPRVDLFVGSQDSQSNCNVPTNGKTIWYFSYITDSAGDYFNYYKAGQPLSFVITMAYNSKNVNDFPEKGSFSLNSALNEMTDIVKALEIK